MAGVGAISILFVASVGAFTAGHVVPILPMAIGAVLLFAGVYAYRFVIEDGGRRRIQHAFRHYLAPALVDRLSKDAGALRLGGERRHVTVLFSDMVGFTSLGERLAAEPERFVEVVNQYLTVLTKAIEQREGYIDKFIGDAVMAIWGAPLSQEQAEILAVEAALEAQAALAEFNRAVVVPGFGLKPLGTRIGIASGEAIVGNMGSKTRMNYTVTGDVVNLAARLESANKHYGTAIIVSGPTAERLGTTDFVLRPLDRLVVKEGVRTRLADSLETSLKLGEGIVRVEASRLAALATFERGLQRYLARDFDTAERIFAGLAETDSVSALYQARALAFRFDPPPEDWDGSYTLETK